MKIGTLTLIGFLWGFRLALAADLSQLYDRPTLEYWQSRYVRTNNKILDEVIWPALTSAEKRSLGAKPVLESPLWADGNAHGHPLAFYAPPDGRTIVLPVLSLKFLDDLCTAYAWLQAKGYSLETISEYTAILWYGEPPATGFPPPLRALGIPEDALKDPAVEENALGHFVTARTFIILHEMGHILHDDAHRTTESIRKEEEADQFASVVMQRTPLVPLGMLVYFMADAHWSRLSSSEPGTHPLSGARVRAFGASVEDPTLREKLVAFGNFLDDPDIRAGFVATGKRGDLAALTPRRPGELPRRPIEAGPTNREVLFDGLYRGRFAQYLNPKEDMAIELVLKRDGDKVLGAYSFGIGVGKIEGSVVDKRLYFEWEWAGNYGQGVFDATNDGSFTGTWGYRESRNSAGTWTGNRSP